MPESDIDEMKMRIADLQIRLTGLEIRVLDIEKLLREAHIGSA